MTQQALVAGGGIGGLAAALACARAGWEVRLYERAAAYAEAGAGIQLGPNVVRVLHERGLAGALDAVAAQPARLQVRSAMTGRELGVLPLGPVFAQRYGAPYLTIHRSDLHAVLLGAVRAQAGVALHTGRSVQGLSRDEHAVTVRFENGVPAQGDLLVGADGLWSGVRQSLLADGPPRPTGHLAYRTLARQGSLPAHFQSHQITVWLGPRLHVVQYPVQRGEGLNVVVIIHGSHAQPGALAQGWDHEAHASGLRQALSGTCTPLQNLIHAMGEWRLWALYDRAPMQGADAQAQGRVALLGDAAHPMRPYLAQGAGMAIEDAAELGRALAMTDIEVPLRLRRYALNRWQRNARVQRRALRNGNIFHASGPVRWGRDVMLRLLGERLLDVPWLYRGG